MEAINSLKKQITLTLKKKPSTVEIRCKSERNNIARCTPPPHLLAVQGRDIAPDEAELLVDELVGEGAPVDGGGARRIQLRILPLKATTTTTTEPGAFSSKFVARFRGSLPVVMIGGPVAFARGASVFGTTGALG